MSVAHLTKTAGLAVLLVLLRGGAARADFKVWTPDVNQGELALEHVGAAGFDHRAARNGERSHTFEVEYDPTSWWLTELEFEFEREPGTDERTRFTALTSENLFQFTERGEYWLDAGFFAEFSHGMVKGDPESTTFGPVLRKEVWGLSNTINLFIEKELGTHAAGRAQFLWAWETRIESWQMKLGRNFVMEPGVQIYGQPGAIGRFASWSEQDNRAGPQLFGQIFDIGPGSLVWNGGILFGLTPAAPKFTPRWQLEYEIHY